MSQDPPIAPPDDVGSDEDLTAAEYALGVLSPQDRAVAEARSETDPVFAREILAWVMRFAPLMDFITPVEPSLALWPRIEAAMDRSSSRGAPLAVAMPAAANDSAPRGQKLWRAWAIGASAIAAAALLFIGVRVWGPAGGPIQGLPAAGAGPTLVARLNLKGTGSGVLTVTYDPRQSTVYASPDTDFSIPTARSAELWLIPTDGKPRPVGVIDPAKPATMPMPPAFRTLATAKTTIALSIEPVGGSPTDSPTGPVIATGSLAQI